MSRIAKQPVEFPNSVEVSIQNDDCIEVKGKKGQLQLNLINKVSVSIGEGSLSVTNTSNSKFSRAISGTYRLSLIHI